MQAVAGSGSVDIPAGSASENIVKDNSLSRWKVYGREEGIAEKKNCTSFLVSNLVKAPLFYIFEPEEGISLLRDRLNTFSKGEECATACRVLSVFIHQYICHTFRYPPHLTRENPDWTAALSRDSEGAISLRGAGIYHTLENSENKLRDAMEAMFLKGTSGLIERLNILAINEGSVHYNPEFLLDLAIKLIEISSRHFSRANETILLHGSHADPNIIRADFGKELHRGLSSDPRYNTAERRKHSIEKFFMGVSETIFKIAMPGGDNDIVMPFGFKKKTFSLIKNVVTPNVLHEITEQVVCSRTLDRLVLQALKDFNAKVSTDKKRKPNPIIANKLDRKQKRLNKACSKLANGLIVLLAPGLFQIVANLPGVLDSIGSSVGNALRKHTEKMDILKIINTAIINGLPNLHTGRWEDDGGRKTFVPGEKLPNGEFHPLSAMSFRFPKNDFERRQKNEALEVSDEDLRQEVVGDLSKTINDQILSIPPTVIKKIMSPFIQARNFIYREFFNKTVAKLALAVEWIFKFFLETVLLNVLYITLYPLARLGEVVVDRYSKNKAKEIISRLHMDIHHNLAYKCLDNVLESIKLTQPLSK